ncbi:MAG: anaerobic ribonucleoside-triphosphate reductase activating protein [Mollicutes bacterium]|nr:anaerobic ribonucleoside-triphosphate reductase activating protein [Mollicutes bacterium]
MPKIAGFNKLTLLDYPGKLACVLFTKGCNFGCRYCQNSSLVLDVEVPLIDHNEIFAYLEKRKNILQGVVISGGEPTIQKGLLDFIIKIKEIGYKVKLDTNGSNPKLLQELIELKLVDYVAMDIKNVFEKYNQTANAKVNIDNVKKSIDILKKGKVDYEFRTTIIKEYHTLEDIRKLIDFTQGSKYYLQNFEDRDTVIKSGLTSFTVEDLNLLYSYKESYDHFEIRGYTEKGGRKNV